VRRRLLLKLLGNEPTGEDPVTQNTKPDERAHSERARENNKEDLPIDTPDPPLGLPDIGAPGLGADEMPGGAITGGDGKLDRKDKKNDQ